MMQKLVKHSWAGTISKSESKLFKTLDRLLIVISNGFSAPKIPKTIFADSSNIFEK